ncbi:N-acetylmuramoyl-L-alanine amidase [Modestobacter italicus]|uniref:N-acetylmuramoyl-L-alanine amidase n=1 Tax=Modestobacter italicus (strain DSM 44449 / CECT 9708 / BC 501) TaxID=2732864 RepID=UPI001C93F7AE|nr:N-acetylmuramoyl-L-alanine amidase [Modestobacter italicus]
MRRLTAGFLAFLALTATLLTMPVYASPGIDAHPVAASIEEVRLGSVVDPRGDAVVLSDGEVQPDGVDAEVATTAPSTVPITTPPSSAPATSAPATTTPAASAPESSASESAGPESSAAAPSTSEGAASESSAPAPSTSDGAASESSAAAPSGSEGSVPEPSAPKSSAPTAPASEAPAPAAGSSAAPDDESVVASGAELPGVPALTVSQEDTDRFSSVGVTWRDDPSVTDVVVQLRVLALDGTWGQWTSLAPDDVEQTESRATEDHDVRGGTAPYWTGPAQGVEAVVQGAGGTVPEDVRIALIDPGTSEADALAEGADPAGTAHAAQAMPRIYTRAEWGADERIRTWQPEYVSTIKAATVHHTADSNNYSADQVPAIMRSMYAYHAQTRGWGDIGYNVIVDKWGRLFEGRYGGLTSTVVGAHAGGFNSYTFGVSMLGNYDVEAVPQAAVDAVGDVIAWKFGLYGVDPRGTTVLTSGGSTSKYAAGTRVTLPTVFGHRDVGSTACPGRYGYARLGEIRNRVAALVDANTSAIERRYATDAAVRASLGAEVGVEQYGDGFAYQKYENGRLYWSPSTGVHLLRGDILAAYLEAGGPAVLGAPTTDEGVAAQGGAYNHFANDVSIYWTAATGAHPIRGGIRQHWLSLGGDWTLGYPTGAEAGVSPGVVRQRFSTADVYWTAATGAHMVRGGIRASWEARGGVATLGVPVTDELYLAGGGVRADFSSGGVLVWGPTTDAWLVYPGIADAWTRSGAAAGPLGFPVADEEDTGVDGGRRVRFQSGDVYWSPATGAQPVWGDIATRVRALGGVRGVGYPLHQPMPAGPADGVYVQFTGVASMYASSATGAHVVLGGIRDHWFALGAEWGRLGMPTSDELPAAGGGRMTVFQGGTVYWGPASGAHAVVGGIGETYARLGGPSSTLGLPVTDEYVVDGTLRQDFLGGALVWMPGSNSVTRVPR